MSSMSPLPAWSTLTPAAYRPSLPPLAMARLARATLFQARRNLGQTWPNPSVGAIIAHPGTGEIVASAATGWGGRPHAEVVALAEAGPRAKGCVLFSTLEPCSHHGATPPCANAIIEAGIAAVIYGSVDPDPRVSGRGLALLQMKGIPVLRGDFAGEADWINLGHSLRVTSGKPFVQIKLAVDARGQVARGTGQPVWVTGEGGRAMAHLLRAEADAILVGRNTLEQDDPQLTCRLPGLEDRSPIRIVLASRPELSARSRMFQDDGPPVWVLCPPAVTKEPESGKVTLLPVPACASGKPDLKAAMKILAQRGITRLLVEGGPTIAKAFLDAGLAEEIVIIQGSGQTPCEGTMLPFLDRGLERLTESPDFIKADERRAGSDRIDIYRSREYWQG